MTPADQRRPIEAHLATCTRCSNSVEFLSQLAETAAADARVDPPEYLVRQAKAVFPEPRRIALPLLERLAARLVWNPEAEPLPAGVRSAYPPVRQMVFEAGDYSVDLRLDSSRESAAVTLVGQIANRHSPTQSFFGTPVILMAGTRAIHESAANESGEFIVEYTPRTKLRLCLPLLQDGVQIEVPLSDYLEGK